MEGTRKCEAAFPACRQALAPPPRTFRAVRGSRAGYLAASADIENPARGRETPACLLVTAESRKSRLLGDRVIAGMPIELARPVPIPASGEGHPENSQQSPNVIA